jgi:regulator of protease activity HflC (stomatin/prohibitin superfamily)
LILFSAGSLYLASCILIVEPHEEAVVERFGNPLKGNTEARLVGPGLHFKLPWPVDIAYKHPTRQVREMYIGYVPRTDARTGQIIPEQSLLWGQTHYEQEHSVLVASEFSGEESGEGVVPVSLVKANLPVQYKIKDLYAYIYNHSQPDDLLEAICYRELTRFAASARVEAGGPGADGRAAQDSLLGAGRAKAQRVISERVQEAADRQGLGVEIILVGLQGIHPPPEVAPDYQAVIGAVQKRQAAVLNAEAERNKTLSTIMGSVAKAYELADLAEEYQAAREQGRAEDAERLGLQLDKAFAEAKGDIFRILREAQSYAFEKATLAKATGERFASQVKAYEAAPEIYTREQRLAVLEEALPAIRKFVVAANAGDTQVTVIDAQEALTPSLYDIGGVQESSEQ